jgi:primosomal protein N'
VLIQTYCPTHYAIRAAARHDYAAFYAEEIRMRQRLRLPPWTHLVELVIRSARREQAHAAVVEPFLKDLRESVDAVRADPSAASKGTAPMYGAAARLPDRGAIRENLIGHLAGLSRLG